MLSKSEKRYLLDVMLIILGFVCAVTGIAIKFRPKFLSAIMVTLRFNELHAWSGYIMTLLVIWHILIHLDWAISIKKNSLLIGKEGEKDQATSLRLLDLFNTIYAFV